MPCWPSGSVRVVPGVGPAIATGPLAVCDLLGFRRRNGTSRLDPLALEEGGVAATLAAHYQAEFEGGRVLHRYCRRWRSSREATDILLDG